MACFCQIGFIGRTIIFLPFLFYPKTDTYKKQKNKDYADCKSYLFIGSELGFSFFSNLTTTAPMRPERSDEWSCGAKNSATASGLPFSKDAFRLPYAISL